MDTQSLAETLPLPLFWLAKTTQRHRPTWSPASVVLASVLLAALILIPSLYFILRLPVTVSLFRKLIPSSSSSSSSMSKPVKSNSKNDERITQFINVTGASTKDATRFLSKHNYKVEAAIDAYYNDPAAVAATAAASKSREGGAKTLAKLFDDYKDPGGDDITIDGTIKLCGDLGVDPEDVVLLAVAYELKSPGVGSWTRKGWLEGWKNLDCDSLPAMKAALPPLRQKLGSDSKYFQQVYNYTFEFAKSEGQRSVSIETACAFWALLLPHGVTGGALSHIGPDADGEDTHMSSSGDGWKVEYQDLWFEFLNEKGGKGVSKDTWTMFLEFVRTIDSKFEKHDLEAAWPSAIDDFVEWAKEKLAAS